MTTSTGTPARNGTTTAQRSASIAKALCRPRDWWSPTERDVARRFPADVAGHVLDIRRDDGNFRHLTFAKPGTGIMHFHLTTWPGYLAISGDMGSFTFCRETDMFAWFRSSTYVNVGYWTEKAVALDRYCDNGGEAHSEDVARAWLESRFAEWQASLEPEDDDVRQELACGLDRLLEVCSDADLLRDALDGFRVDGMPQFSFSDLWEDSWNAPDYHLVWCLYAIAWGIRMYDTVKAKGDERD